MPEETVRERLKLTKEQKENLLKMEGDIIWLRQELDRAKRAGIADEQMETKIQELISLREGLLREYS